MKVESVSDPLKYLWNILKSHPINFSQTRKFRQNPSSAYPTPTMMNRTIYVYINIFCYLCGKNIITTQKRQNKNNVQSPRFPDNNTITISQWQEQRRISKPIPSDLTAIKTTSNVPNCVKCIYIIQSSKVIVNLWLVLVPAKKDEKYNIICV